jgi:glycosyltransferase involved in cell wall biosynthesis
MPAFNSEAFIFEAVESVIRQTYNNWELIIIDEWSTDKTSEIVAGFIEADDRIRYVHQINSGPAAARNKGIQNSRGRYIAFLDSDDIWYLDKLEKQMNFLASHPGYVVYGGRNYILEGKGRFVESGQIRVFKNFSTIEENIEYFLYNSNLTITSTLLFEKSLLEKTGYFDETLHICEDDNLILRMAAYQKFHALNEPVDYRRKHDQSITGSGEIRIAVYRYRAIQRALERIPDPLLPWKKTDILSRWSLTYSIGAFDNKRYFTSFLWFLRGFWVSPLYAIQYFNGKLAKKIKNKI